MDKLPYTYSKSSKTSSAPFSRDEYAEDELPFHPCMELVGNCEQVLSKLTARRLLTYQKISNNIPNMPHDQHGAAHNFR